MADEHATQQESTKKGPIRRWIDYTVYNKVSTAWNRIFGGKYGQIPQITIEGKEQPNPILQQFRVLFEINQGLIGTLKDIEGKWSLVETKLFGDDHFHYQEKPGSDVITDIYRKMEYFRDPELTKREASIFKEFGTIQLKEKKFEIDKRKVLKKANETKSRLEEQKRTRRLSEDEKEELENTEEFITNIDNEIEALSLLPQIEVKDVVMSYIDGRPQKVIAIGASNMIEIRQKFETLKDSIDHFASSSGFGANVRTPINQLLAKIVEDLKQIEKIELGHGEKLSVIAQEMKQLESEAGAGLAETNRPNKELIRFAHTYKIIKQYMIEEFFEDGKKIERVVYFKDKYPGFKRSDEIEAGKDENNWPLEVFEEHGEWFVLTDRWWEEISENEWQEKIIKSKTGGEEVWKNKVVDGVKKSTPYGKIRKIPDKRFIGDIDPLDKISFISNETDSFRDDFRDGRYHWHSKSSMDYVIAGLFGINPVVPITLRINTQDPETRIKFRPVYYTKVDTTDKAKIGMIYDKEIRGLGINPSRIIPEDEKKVSRKYDMETEAGILKDEVRKPTHLNPAFDRAALDHKFIHWGRMLYYETTDGINKWSENPFPHVATRGLAKYIIDFVLRNSFSFENARNTLKGGEWDYGIRHYGEPFITDPLGSEGVLEHAKAKLRESGGH